MTIGQLEVLRSLAQHGSLARTAEELCLSRASVSERLQALEKAVACELVDRTDRPLRLTEAGGSFLARIDPALERFCSLLPQLAGRAVTIGYTITTEGSVVSRLLDGAAEVLPDVEVRLRRVWTAEACEGVLDGELDLAIVRHPPWSARLRSECLWDTDLVLRIPRTHRWARRSQIHLRELAGEEIVVIPRALSPGTYDLIESTLRQGGAGPRLVNNPVLFTRIADQPEGFSKISISPELPDTDESGTFVQVPIAGLKRHQRMGVHVITRATDSANPTTNALVDVLRRIAEDHTRDAHG